MTTSFTEISLEALMGAVRAHIDCQRKIEGDGSLWINLIDNMVDGFNTSLREIHSGGIKPVRGFGTNAFGNYGIRGRGARFGSGCGGRGYISGAGTQVRTCHYCRKAAYFIKFCRLRIQDERPGNIQKTSQQCFPGSSNRYNGFERSNMNGF